MENARPLKDAPLLLVHGYPFDHTMWFSTIASLGAHARVFAPDLPGFGKNPVPRGEEPSLEYYADFLASFVRANQEEKVAVAGMSMGGYVALAFAEKYPSLLCALGLISSQTAADPPETQTARRETASKIRAHGVSVALEMILPKMFSDKAAADLELRRFPIEGAERAGIDGLCWALEAMARRPDRTAVVTSLRSPVLVVHGSDDKIVPVAKARALVDSCRDPIFVEIHGAGHATPLEAPDQLATALAGLMSGCRSIAAESSA